MKKLPILLILVSALSLGSCASKGWSCSKRYCNATESPVKKEKIGQDKKVNA